MMTQPLIFKLPKTACDPLRWAVALRPIGGLVFFDSALAHHTLGRYSFIAADPFHRLMVEGAQVKLDGVAKADDPFTIIENLMARYRLEPIADLPPFQGGIAGIFGYGLRHYIERLPRHRHDDQGIPDLVLGAYDLVIAFDHVTDNGWIISSGLPAIDIAREKRAKARIAWALDLFDRSSDTTEDSNWAIAARPEMSSADYKSMVRKTINYIEAGDIYQANMTQRFRASLHSGIDRLKLYRTLRRRNPATFASFIEFGDIAILSSSPERFLSLRNGKVETRPIKGTRPRGRNSTEDQSLSDELLASEKDRAENLMIVDLLRNDISRVCYPGSVKVPELWKLESYSTVHHLVSVVTGKMLADKSAVDLLRAAFPGGSVTGAPKIRAMEIIAELEPTARGPYCGALGYLGFDGSLDSSIVIRSYCIKGDDLTFQVGGGIVADSDPALEFEESLVKAKALIEVLACRGHARSDFEGSAA